MINKPNNSCRNTVYTEPSNKQTTIVLLIGITVLFGLLCCLLGGCNTVTPIDPNGAYVFRDASSAPSKDRQGNQNVCVTSTPNQNITSKKSQTSWLGSSRDPHSTVPKEQTPLISSSRDISELTLGPCDPVARVGTQVIMVAGVKDKGGTFRKNMQVQWSIDSSTPGRFMNIDRRDWEDIFAGEWEAPHIESPCLAYTSTSRKSFRITKGTPSTSDDVFIHEGQTWAMIGSDCEGTTRLTAIATDSADWQNRAKAANIHWIDAWPVMPPSKIAQNYNQPLNIQTGIYKYNGNVAPGCIVVYEILDNSDDAQFKIPSAEMPSATDFNSAFKYVTVPIDERGLCEIQLVRTSQNAGQTRFRTTVIRDNADGRFTVPIRLAQSETIVDWGNTGLQVKKSGPTVISGGKEAAYRITVQNVNSEPINQVVVTDNVPDSFEYLRSAPTGKVADAFTTLTSGQRIQQIQWTIPTLNAGEKQQFDVVYRVTQEGNYYLGAVARAGNVSAEDVFRTRVDSSCARCQTPAMPTNVTESSNGLQPFANLDIQIVCPDRANTGDNFVLHTYIKNNGSETLAQTNATVSYTSGLSCSFGTNPVHLNPLNSIIPGQTRDISMNFKAVSSGRQTITMEFVTDSNQRFTRQIFITVDGNDSPATSNLVPQQKVDNSSSDNSTSNPVVEQDENNSILEKQSQSSVPINAGNQVEELKKILSVTFFAPQKASVGEQFNIDIKVTNLSNNSLDKIQLTFLLDNNLQLQRNTTGMIKEANNKVSWNIDSIPPRCVDQYTLVVTAKTAMPTLSRILLTKDNINIADQECTIEISNSETFTGTNPSENSNNSLVPEPIPATNMPESIDNSTQTPVDSALDNTTQDTSINNTNANPVDSNSSDSNFITPSIIPIDQSDNLQQNTDNKLNIELTSRRNSVKINQPFTCQLKITNTTSNIINNITVSFFVHIEAFKLIKFGTTGNTNYTYNPQNGTITFAPAATLEPNKTLNYTIRLLPKQTGVTILSTSISAKENGSEDVTQNAQLEVNVE